MAAVTVRSEPLTYFERGRHSFFADLAAERTGNQAASERLHRHRQEMAVEGERREVLRLRAFQRAAEPLGMKAEYRDLTTTDTAGGTFVPPLWLLDQVGTFPRAGRVLADRMVTLPLPAGTDSVSVPRITTGTATAIQTANNAVVQETDIVDAGVTAPVRTIAGQADASVQLVEQSGAPGFDRFVYADLLADYNAKLGTQLISGTGSSGQVTGLVSAAGTTVTYTDATPTAAETYTRIADLASQVATARMRVPSVVVMAPRRAFWLMAALDAQDRPLNPIDFAAPERDPNREPVGAMLTMALVLEPNMPTTLGAGTNEDAVLTTTPDDLLLLEGEPRLTLNVDPGSGTLTTRFGLHRYVAFIGGRIPASTGVLSGTGLVTPVFP